MTIANPMGALTGLQTALDAQTVSLQACELHPKLAFLVDEPNGKVRFTYALIENGAVIAVALFVLTDRVKGVPCFNIGYAVVESRRGTGVATQTLEQGIE